MEWETKCIGRLLYNRAGWGGQPHKGVHKTFRHWQFARQDLHKSLVFRGSCAPRRYFDRAEFRQPEVFLPVQSRLAQAYAGRYRLWSADKCRSRAFTMPSVSVIRAVSEMSGPPEDDNCFQVKAAALARNASVDPDPGMSCTEFHGTARQGQRLAS